MTTKKQMDEEYIELTARIMPKKQLAEMYLKLNKTYLELVKYLYDNYLPVLREWEAMNGSFRIMFARDKKKEELQKEEDGYGK